MAEKPGEMKTTEEMKRRPYRTTVHDAPDTPTATTERIEASAAATEGNRDIAEIEAGIRQTQAEMDETIHVIEEKLSSSGTRLKEQAQSQAQEAKEATMEMAKYVATSAGHTMERMRERITVMVKENPMPLALVGLGLAWFLKGAKKSSEERYGGRTESYLPGREAVPGYEYAGQYEYEYPEEMEYTYREPSGRTRQTMEKAKEYTGEAKGKMQETMAKAKEVASDVQEKAQQYMGKARHQMEHMGETTRYRTQRTGGGLTHMVQERPLSIGLAAIALGAIIGLSIPESRWEEETMGQTRDDLLYKAKESAREVGYEAKEKVSRVAEEAGRAAKEEAKKQDLPV